MSGELVGQLGIIAFGVLWICCGVYDYLRTPPFMRELLGAAIMGFFMACAVVAILFFAGAFVAAVIGVFTR